MNTFEYIIVKYIYRKNTLSLWTCTIDEILNNEIRLDATLKQTTIEYVIKKEIKETKAMCVIW